MLARLTAEERDAFGVVAVVVGLISVGSREILEDLIGEHVAKGRQGPMQQYGPLPHPLPDVPLLVIDGDLKSVLCRSVKGSQPAGTWWWRLKTARHLLQSLSKDQATYTSPYDGHSG